MKTYLMTLSACILMTSCVIGVRSNMNFIRKSIDAKNEAKVKEENEMNGGSPAVNADKSYSDMLNGSGNNNGAGQSSRDEKNETPASAEEPAKN